MSQVSTSLEFLLKIRQQGQEILDQATRQIDDLAAAQRRAGATVAGAALASREGASASGELANAQRQVAAGAKDTNAEISLQRTALSGLAGTLRTAAASYIGLAGARRALTLASGQEQTELRLLGLLNAQLASREEALDAQRELIDLSRRLERETGIFAAGDFLGGARQLIAQTGQSDLDFERLLRVSADTAAALFDNNIDQAVRAVAQSFGGQTGELGRLLPELQEIRRELAPRQFQKALKDGLVVDLLETRFGGVAAEVAGSEAGRALAVRNRTNDLLERLGFVLLPAVNSALDIFVSSLEGAALGAAAIADPRRLVDDLIEILGGGIGLASARLQPDNIDAQRARLTSTADALDTDVARIALRLTESIVRAFSQDRADALRDLREANTDFLRVLAGQTPQEPIPQSRDPRGGDARAFGLGDFDDQTRRELVAQLGLVSELDAAVLALEDNFRRLGAAAEFPAGFFDEGPLREGELFFNLAKNAEVQQQLLRDLGKAQDEYNRALARANDLADAGQISDARRNELVTDARARLADSLRLGDEAAAATVERNRALLEELQGLVDEEGNLLVTIDLSPKTQLDENLREALERARQQLEEGADQLTSLSREYGERLQSPLAGFFDQLAEGEVGLLDFLDVFRRTLQRIVAELIAADLTKFLFGGSRASPGGGGFLGGLFDGLGAFLGFDQGGFVPGPYRGRDDRIIAVAGGEHITRAPVVALPGVREHLSLLNAGDLSSIDFSRLRGAIGPRMPSPRRSHSSSVPGYNAGGFVDAFASVSASGARDPFARDGGSGGGVTVLPVMVTDERSARRLLGGRAARDEILAAQREASGGGSTIGGAPGARGLS